MNINYLKLNKIFKKYITVNNYIHYIKNKET